MGPFDLPRSSGTRRLRSGRRPPGGDRASQVRSASASPFPTVISFMTRPVSPVNRKNAENVIISIPYRYARASSFARFGAFSESGNEVPSRSSSRSSVSSLSSSGICFLGCLRLRKRKRGAAMKRLPLVTRFGEKVRPLDRGGRTCGYRAGISSSRSAAAAMWNAMARMSLPSRFS